MLLKKFLVLIDTWGLALLVALTLGAFGMATREGMSGPSGLSLWESVMVTITSEARNSEGWTRHMHVLGKTTLAWAAVRVYMATAGLKWDNFSARWMARSHVVIVAGRADPQARVAHEVADKTPLAIDLAHALAPQHTVVLAVQELDAGERRRLWDAGVTVLAGNQSLPQLLAATGARRARMLIAMRDYHGDNVTLTRAAMSPDLRNPQLEVKCLIEPLAVRHDFRVEEYFDASTLPRIRVFNESELVARRILQAFPPDTPVARSDTDAVHVLVVGLGSVGQSILLQLARMGHYRSGLRPKVTAVDAQVTQRWREACDAHPSLPDWLRVRTEEIRFEEAGREEVRSWLADESAVTAIYVCTKDEVVNLRLARMLLQELKAPGLQDLAPVAPVVALDPPGGCILSDFAAYGEHAGRFHLFSLVRGSSGFLSEVDDARARQFHEAYCRRDDQQCQRDPSCTRAVFNRPWNQLEETVRNANRMTADHFEVKMRAIGCRLVPRGTTEPAQLGADELELLARMDHDRWWADRALDGWRQGEPRDNSRKIHPNMVPYDALPEAIRELDRQSVLQALDILEREGLVMARHQRGEVIATAH